MTPEHILRSPTQNNWTRNHDFLYYNFLVCSDLLISTIKFFLIWNARSFSFLPNKRPDETTTMAMTRLASRFLVLSLFPVLQLITTVFQLEIFLVCVNWYTNKLILILFFKRYDRFRPKRIIITY